MTPKPDPKRRSPASRPGKAGDPARRRRSTKTVREHVVEPIKRQLAESVEQRSDQRLGFTARRAAVLAAVICVLTLTIAGPVRTYFAQRTEMNQLSASEAALRRQIADLEQKKVKLGDPAYIAAQARERLGFVKPGDIPFQVQLPPSAATPQPGSDTAKPASGDPWYTALWHTIADAPHLPPSNTPPTPTAPGG
ncbi:septum formation initiator family protein [Mycobacterium sp. SP-6446]|uniref:FtsB family cell division protein n=1 Tax=Mycobacterium sp. SP-6446 TaxID=1834162 RepID=UPI00096C08CA|nr:septum formation initiator family protein [Mycobacterium sp. SP-6446]OMC15725.1 septation inhibitor protein [Mycobacterium sp. SP-6446]